MFVQIILLSMFLLCEVHSDELSDATWRDMNDNTVQLSEYCERKKCIAKCCPKGYFIAPIFNKWKCVPPQKEQVRKLLHFSEIYVYEMSNSSIIATNESIVSTFHFVQNDIFTDLKRSALFGDGDVCILEDGTVTSGPLCNTKHAPELKFCVDLKFVNFINTTHGIRPNLVFTARTFIPSMEDGRSKQLFVIIGLVISSFFSLLVLVVYSLISKLRTLPGLILMAYLATFIATCILKVVLELGIYDNLIHHEECRHLSPALYYVILSTFFWLSAMSFDVWRLMTKPIQRGNTQGGGQVSGRDWMKFRRYCAYAWITPVIVTLLTVAVDRFNLYTSNDYKPPFDCFRDDATTRIYLHVPVGIITAVNSILFAMAAYKIWVIRGQVSNNAESRNTKSSESRFFTCLKVYVLMGVTWILELLPNELPFGLFIAINFCNMFVGVAIFYIFVCKKTVIIALCKRFGIHNKFVDRLQPCQYKTETPASTKTSSVSEKVSSTKLGSA